MSIMMWSFITYITAVGEGTSDTMLTRTTKPTVKENALSSLKHSRITSARSMRLSRLKAKRLTTRSQETGEVLTNREKKSALYLLTKTTYNSPLSYTTTLSTEEDLHG